ncbi:glycosyl hydrolase catalytic core-domain-containing protein [Fomitopsis betulina]|nr:glycosyl hydrolase catalytic core-domain-containing protein [Fomitopsis betulina]
MISLKLLNLLTVGGVALFVSSLAPSVNGLSNVGGGKHTHLNRLAAHEGLAKRAAKPKTKRSLTKRCKDRSSNSTSSANSTIEAAASTTWLSTAEASSTEVSTTEWSSSADWTPSAEPTTTDAPSTTWTPTSSSTEAAPSSTGSTTTSSGSKVGVAWSGSNDQEIATVKTSATKYLYTWSAWKPDNADSLGYEFWPMLHDASAVSDFESNVVAGYGTNILGFNEPEISGQANMDVATAVSLWRQYIQPKTSLGYGLISPAVTSDSAGVPWLQSFISQCPDCTFTAGCALHWYGTDPQEFISYVQTFQSTFAASCSVLHVTEFACMVRHYDFSGGTTPSDSQIWNFYSTAIQWMNSQSYIGSYFAFGILDSMGNVIQADALLSNGQPTSLGENYINNSW